MLPTHHARRIPLMSETLSSPPAHLAPWDARAARALVRPLQHTWVTPNHLTTVRLVCGLVALSAFTRGSYGWMNAGALLLVVSNILDHTDGELARLSGKTSRLGHWYDLASDALITSLLFPCIGAGVGVRSQATLNLSPLLLGTIAGVSVALIILLRMRIEAVGGKGASQQASLGGFQTEDILYLVPLVTLCSGASALLLAAAIGSPLYALWVIFDYRRRKRGTVR